MAKRNISLIELCDSIAESSEVLGARDRYVSIVSPIDESDRESLTFCSKNTDDGLPMIRNSRAGVIICSKELSYKEDDYKDKTLILVSHPRLAFIQVMQRYFKEKTEFGIHPTATIDKEAKIHSNVYIGPNTYIGKCEIEENTIIHGNAYIYSKTRIGRNVVIGAGTIIGAEGLSYDRMGGGAWEKFPQIGGVIIEDDVEIGSNVSIMKGALVNTLIGQGTKIGHLCSIGHNVIIGKHCIIVTQSMIGGSCRIGDNSWIGLGACIREWINIGKNTFIGMGSVVTKNVDDGWVVYGTPAKKIRKVE